MTNGIIALIIMIIFGTAILKLIKDIPEKPHEEKNE